MQCACVDGSSVQFQNKDKLQLFWLHKKRFSYYRKFRISTKSLKVFLGGSRINFDI